MNLESGIIFLIILIPSVILHEVAHGWVADRLGDPTARLLGRLTLNPIPHIDPVMSIFLPLILILGNFPIIFGAAKPVPVDPFNLRDGRRDMALVSLAGPLTNFLIAALAALIIRFGASFISDPFVATILFRIVWLNLILGIFNLIPIPPLDGSKIFSLILSERQAASYLSIGNVGFILVLAFVYFFGSVISGLLSFALRLLGL